MSGDVVHGYVAVRDEAVSALLLCDRVDMLDSGTILSRVQVYLLPSYGILPFLSISASRPCLGNAITFLRNKRW
jgi:hypothetical protein